MSTLQIVFAIASALAAFFGIVVPIWRSRHQYGIRWAILEPKSMMDIAEEIAEDVTIQYKSRIITDLTKYQFILHNTGSSPLEEKDIVVPLTWTGPGTVLNARILVSEPPVELSLSIKDNAVEFSWLLFNQRCKALVEILCEKRTPTEKGDISGQIRNVPYFEEKQVSVVDEDEIIKRLKSTSQLNSFVIFRPLNRLFINKWSLRVSKWIIPVYLVVGPLWLAFILKAKGSISTVYFVVAVFVVMFIVGIAFLYLRNPYASLVRKARQRTDKGVRT